MKFFIVTFPHSMRYPMIFSEFTLCLYTTEKWRFCFTSCTNFNKSPVVLLHFFHLTERLLRWPFFFFTSHLHSIISFMIFAIYTKSYNIE